MMQGWEERRLKDIGITQTGTTPKTSDRENYGDFIPFIKPADIDIYNDGKVRYDNDGLSKEGLRSGRKIAKGSILMVCIGATIGKVGYVEHDVSCNQQVNSLSVSKEFFPKFFYYALSTPSFYEQVMKYSAQATLPIINKGKWECLTIKYPKSLFEQQRIAAILDEAFAAIAKAKANAEQNLKNAKELFESYLQNVFENKAEGWEEQTVQELVEKEVIYKPLDGNHGEIHPLKNDYVDTGIPFIMSRDMKDGFIDEKNCKFISEKQARSLRTGFAISGDVLLSHKGTIGSVAILQTKSDFVVLTPQITYYRIKDHSKFLNGFIYYQFLSPSFQRTINGIAESGSTRAYIGITKQLSLKLKIAPLNAQKTIAQKLDVLSVETKKLTAVYQAIINNLDELKKSILQKAFSGELTRVEVVA